MSGEEKSLLRGIWCEAATGGKTRGCYWLVLSIRCHLSQYSAIAANKRIDYEVNTASRH